MGLSMKECGRCFELERTFEKPESEFYKREASNDGLQALCKQCMKELSYDKMVRLRDEKLRRKLAGRVDVEVVK